MHPILRLILACVVLAPASWSFEVTRNINSGKPPVEKAVIFDKTKPHSHLSFTDSDGCRLSYLPDGAIESRIIGRQAIAPRITWTEGNGCPASFDVGGSTYLIITCRLEGLIRETRNGKKSERRADNLWIGPSLFNAAGEKVGGIGLAELTEDGKTPAETAVLRIPLIVCANAKIDGTRITGIGFTWGSAHDYQERDFHLVIDRIVLAD